MPRPGLSVPAALLLLLFAAAGSAQEPAPAPNPPLSPALPAAPVPDPAPVAPLAYADVKDRPYLAGYLDLMKRECELRAKLEIVLSVERLQKQLTPAEVNEALMRFLPSTDTVEVIVAKAVDVLDRKFSTKYRLFDPDKLNVLFAGLLFLFCIGYYTWRARSGENLYIRKIAGLASIDEAVGRCTEMGKPVLYVPGIYDMDDIQTISSMSILGHIAKVTAEYETPILVPCTRSLVMSTAYEVVKEAYLKAGKADSFVGDNIRYLTDDQFGYVAGIDGIMMREKPAANFYLGVFFAESLILAETGHSIGSIQIAGTAMVHQIPFFVAACDYTLIGEELFAASAYLSRDPLQLGSIKGQDMSKVIMLLVLLAGVLLASFGHGDFVVSMLKAR